MTGTLIGEGGEVQQVAHRRAGAHGEQVHAGPNHLRLEPGDAGGVLGVLGHDDLRRESEAGSAGKDYHERGEMSNRMTRRNAFNEPMSFLFALQAAMCYNDVDDDF